MSPIFLQMSGSIIIMYYFATLYIIYRPCFVTSDPASTNIYSSGQRGK